MLAIVTAIILDRTTLRDAMAEQGFVSRTGSTRVIVCDLFPTRGAYGSDGTVFLDYGANGTDLASLRTRVHEEMHGVGPDSPDEVATELATHAFFAHYGVTLPDIAYADEYARASYYAPFRRHSFAEMVAWAVGYKQGSFDSGVSDAD